MGMAGAQGMLRRTLYENTLFRPNVMVAIGGGLLIALGFLVFLFNLISTLGLGNVLGLFVPEKWLSRRQAAAA
jgi:cytochrome c oxidase subunit 1